MGKAGRQALRGFVRRRAFARTRLESPARVREAPYFRVVATQYRHAGFRQGAKDLGPTSRTDKMIVRRRSK